MKICMEMLYLRLLVRLFIFTIFNFNNFLLIHIPTFEASLITFKLIYLKKNLLANKLNNYFAVKNNLKIRCNFLLLLL